MNYSIDERVWVQLNPSAPWWPAIVVEAAAIGVAPPVDTDLCVAYYPDRNEYDFCSDPHTVLPFEVSSGKASTTDEALLRAIEAAMNDTSARPLRADVVSSTTMGAKSRGGATAPSRNVRVRTIAADASELPVEGTPMEDVLAVVEDLKRAAVDGSVSSARKALVVAARMTVGLDALRESRLGEAVAAMFVSRAFSTLHPLCRALLAQYLSKLPLETRQAMKQLRARGDFFTRGRGGDADASAAAAAAPAPTDAAGTSEEPSGAAPRAAVGGRDDFRTRLLSAMSLPIGDPPLETPRDVNDVVGELTRLPAHVRIDVAARLSDAEHTVLRRRLLDGTLRPADWESLTEEELLTPSERRLRSERFASIAEAERLETQASQALMESAQFECDVCHQRRCTYYSVQIRSGDEPATTFITCLNCNNTWSEN